MSELIVPPPAAAAVYEFLTAGMASRAGFTDVRAYGRVPSPRPARFVLVTRAGGAQVDLVTTEPLMLVESWGRSDQDAESIADLCHGLLMRGGRDGWLGTVPVRGVGVASLPQRLPDPVSGQDRYSAMYTPLLRGVVV